MTDAEDPAKSAGKDEPGKGGNEKTASSDKTAARPVRVADDKAELTQVMKATRKAADDGIILVPVDFSPHSEAAMVFASELAASTGHRLLVLHVVHDPGEMPGYYSRLVKKKRVDRIQDTAREVFDDFMGKMTERHPGLKALRKADSLMVVGLPVTRILQVIDKLRPVMVVMGSQGRTGLKHLFLGSKAEQVVQLATVPVTIVKHNK
jgi:nucleotide-binding universal stress UspA family protein